jgi:hypothetical protein
MKKNFILYAVAAVAVYYILKKKGIIGESIENEARQMTAEEINNLNFKIDRDNYEKDYIRSQMPKQNQNIQYAKVCN